MLILWFGHSRPAKQCLPQWGLLIGMVLCTLEGTQFTYTHGCFVVVSTFRMNLCVLHDIMT